MNDKTSFIKKLAAFNGICPYEDCKCEYLEEAVELQEPEELPPQGIHEPETQPECDVLLTEERTATMTSYRYAPTERAYAACHDRHYLGKVDFYETIRGVDLNWGNANREQFYGIAKSYLEWLLIAMVDSLKELEITFQISVRPNCRRTARELIQEWKEAVVRFDHQYHEKLVENDHQETNEPRGVANED